MKIGGQFNFDLQSLTYDCDARQGVGNKEHPKNLHCCSSGQWIVSDGAACPDGSTQCELPSQLQCAPVLCSPVQPTIDRNTVKFVGQNIFTLLYLDITLFQCR